MKPRLLTLVVTLFSLAIPLSQAMAQQAGSESSAAQTTYVIDNDHTSVQFKVEHLGISWVHGRFNQADGKFTMNADGAMNSVELTMHIASVDTKNKQRDAHLRSADFFDVENHPDIVFKSSSIEPTDKGLKVKGQVTLHGESRLLTFELVGGKKAEFPEGVHRIGYSTSFSLKRSDFGMKTMLGPVGDTVHAEVSFEGIKK